MYDTIPSLQSPALPWLLLVLSLLVSYYYVRVRPARRMWVRRKRGEQGEADAAHILAERGYTILSAQHGGEITLQIDGEAVSFLLRADYLVRDRRGRILLCEVKTGEVAPSLRHGPTRRQLLEYSLAYGDQVDGVLLLAPEQGDLHEVAFPALASYGRRRSFLHSAFLLLFGGFWGFLASWVWLQR